MIGSFPSTAAVQREKYGSSPRKSCVLLHLFVSIAKILGFNPGCLLDKMLSRASESLLPTKRRMIVSSPMGVLWLRAHTSLLLSFIGTLDSHSGISESCQPPAPGGFAGGACFLGGVQGAPTFLWSNKCIWSGVGICGISNPGTVIATGEFTGHRGGKLCCIVGRVNKPGFGSKGSSSPSAFPGAACVSRVGTLSPGSASFHWNCGHSDAL